MRVIFEKLGSKSLLTDRQRPKIVKTMFHVKHFERRET